MTESAATRMKNRPWRFKGRKKTTPPVRVDIEAQKYVKKAVAHYNGDSLEKVARDMYAYIDDMMKPGERTRWDARAHFKQRLKDLGVEVEG